MSEREREWFGEHLWHPTLFKASGLFSFVSCVGCVAMECHCDRLPGRFISTGAKNTMSSMVMPAKEFHETDDGQPTAACQVLLCPSRKKLVTTKKPAPTREGWSRRHRGACLRHGDTDDVFPRQAVESNALLFSLDQPLAGFLVKSMRSIPTNMVAPTCERVKDCCSSHVKGVTQ